MRKLLVPIDFSPTSAAALQYGVFLADLTGHDLEVVHIYDGFGETNRMLEVRGGDPVVQKRVQSRLRRFVRERVSPLAFTGTADGEELPLIAIHAIIGEAPEAIVRLSRDPEVGLIVMGGVGAGEPINGRTFTYGSVTRAVALRGGCPVLLIPRDYGIPKIKSLAFAFDEVRPLRQVAYGAEFLRHALGAGVRLVHLMDANARREERKQYELLIEVLETAFPAYPVELDLLPPGDLATALSTYVLTRDIDLLVTGRRPGSFWERLFVAPRVQSLIDRIPIPLLVVPISSQ